MRSDTFGNAQPETSFRAFRTLSGHINNVETTAVPVFWYGGNAHQEPLTIAWILETYNFLNRAIYIFDVYIPTKSINQCAPVFFSGTAFQPSGNVHQTMHDREHRLLANQMIYILYVCFKYWEQNQYSLDMNYIWCRHIHDYLIIKYSTICKCRISIYLGFHIQSIATNTFIMLSKSSNVCIAIDMGDGLYLYCVSMHALLLHTEEHTIRYSIPD